MSLLKYPYTNLHELNLDWLIEQLNKESPVVSVNGKQGIVTLTGQDINRVPNDTETLSGALDELDGDIGDINEKIGTTALPTTAQTLTGAIAEHETDITGINNKIGTTVLPTTAQTLTGAAAELDGDVTTINNKIGNTALPTTAQTLTGAVSEISGQIIKSSAIQEDAKSYGGGGTAVTNTTFVLAELSLTGGTTGILFIDASGTAEIDINDVMVFRLYDGETLLGSFGSSNLQGKQWISASGHYKLSSAAHSLKWVLTTYGGSNIQVPAYCSLTGRLAYIPLPA